MRRKVKIISILFICVFLSAVCFSEGEKWSREKLTSDPRFDGAKESFDKALYHIELGNKNFPKRPGFAKKHYETAEDYFSTAGFKYKNLGHEYGIDTSNEVDICEQAQRTAHVKNNKAMKLMGRYR